MSIGDRMSRPGSEQECEQLVDAAAYVLRALEPHEAERYREHLDGCSVCSAEVSSLQPIVDALPASTPRVFAPEVLRERIMATALSEAQLLHAAGSDADRAGPARPRWGLRRRQWLIAAVAMAAGLLIGAVAIDTGSQSSATHVTSALASSPKGTHAVLREVGGHAELVVAGVSQPPRGKIYEIWIARAGAAPRPTNALFGVTHSGSASVDVPGNLAGVHQVLVTAEPLGGSAHPTSMPIIVATLRSS
jgi:Anti-sigma-K factor rskA